MEKSIYKSVRELGLESVLANNWQQALLYLNAALRQGHRDIAILDAFGEAAYRTSVPEALGPYQNYYKYPTLATHMARAFLMLGDLTSTKEFLNYAKDSALKSALTSMLLVGSEIKDTVAAVLPVAETYPDLYYPEYWRSLSAIADAVGREDLTRLSERKSKKFAYKDPNIHFNQALRMLGKGEFRAGWRLYEWRLVPNANQANRTELGSIPMWEGEKIKNKSLLVFLEQGLGDGIFSLRYIQPLLDEGAIIEIGARPAIIPLIQSTYPNIKIHNEDEVAIPGYWDKVTSPDFWVYGLSIPYRAGILYPTHTDKFLSVAPPMIDKAKEKIRQINKTNLPVYTVNWHGRIDTESDKTRAFSVQEFAHVTEIDKTPCLVICLQKDATADEINSLESLVVKRGGCFINASPDLNNFADTAAWISASDRLLTCDTSVAHVGGAIGHPTTVFARNKAIWQWLRKDRRTNNIKMNNNNSSFSEPKISRAVWYDSVLVQYALTPEISCLFTSMKQNEVSNDNFANSNKSQSDSSENSQLLSGEVRATRFRGAFNFAGRSESISRNSC